MAEAERIAHDLHDAVGGLLTAAHLLSSDLAERLAPPEAAVAARVAAYTASAMEQVRSACHALTAPVDTAAELSAVAAEADGAGGVRCTASIASAASLPSGADGRELVLIVREAVTNALRHARARTISLSVAPGEGGLIVQIADDGEGRTAGPHTGLGTATMQTRARRIGASLSVESAPGEGTTVRVVLPTARRRSSPTPSPPSHA